LDVVVVTLNPSATYARVVPPAPVTDE